MVHPLKGGGDGGWKNAANKVFIIVFPAALRVAFHWFCCLLVVVAVVQNSCDFNGGGISFMLHSAADGARPLPLNVDSCFSCCTLKYTFWKIYAASTMSIESIVQFQALDRTEVIKF